MSKESAIVELLKTVLVSDPFQKRTKEDVFNLYVQCSQLVHGKSQKDIFQTTSPSK